ncbi:hypothetical protein [Clostridium sp. DL1XJH146]
MNSNTSGHGEFSEIPEDIKKWNWGAFWLTWIWGLGNCTYISLLTFIPIINLIMPFYLGKNGNVLAWKNRAWLSVDVFKETQKKWAFAGWVFLLIILTMTFVRVLNYRNYTKEINSLTSTVYEMIENDEEASEVIGEIYSSKFGGLQLQETQTNRETFYPRFILILETSNGIFFIQGDLDDNKKVESLTISEFGDDENDKRIYIKAE